MYGKGLSYRVRLGMMVVFFLSEELHFFAFNIRQQFVG